MPFREKTVQMKTLVLFREKVAHSFSLVHDVTNKRLCLGGWVQATGRFLKMFFILKRQCEKVEEAFIIHFYTEVKEATCFFFW